MKEILATLTRIEALLPPPLDPPPPCSLPELAALPRLAEYMGAPAETAAGLTALAQRLGAQRGRTGELQAAAHDYVTEARIDLTSLALAVLRAAGPAAVQSLLPEGRPAAEAELAVLAREGVTQAEARSAELDRELAPLAVELEQVAAEAETPEERPDVEAEPISSAAGSAAVAAALSQLGTPYVWGGTQPGGFDCSGLVQWAYRQAGVELPRTAEEMTVGTQVTADQLQPGDLAVWDGHVAMYIGDGQMVEAGDPVQTNPVRTSNMSMAFQGFWRPAS